MNTRWSKYQRSPQEKGSLPSNQIWTKPCHEGRGAQSFERQQKCSWIYFPFPDLPLSLSLAAHMNCLSTIKKVNLKAYAFFVGTSLEIYQSSRAPVNCDSFRQKILTLKPILHGQGFHENKYMYRAKYLLHKIFVCNLLSDLAKENIVSLQQLFVYSLSPSQMQRIRGSILRHERHSTLI